MIGWPPILIKFESVFHLLLLAEMEITLNHMPEPYHAEPYHAEPYHAHLYMGYFLSLFSQLKYILTMIPTVDLCPSVIM